MSSTSIGQSGGGNKRGGLAATSSDFQTFSQEPEDVIFEGQEEEDNCALCNDKKQDAWVACDSCDRWFHYSCVGITVETAPNEKDRFDCPDCRRGEAVNLKRLDSEAPQENLFMSE